MRGDDGRNRHIIAVLQFTPSPIYQLGRARVDMDQLEEHSVVAIGAPDFLGTQGSTDMAIGTFSPPKGWENWATLVIGVWLWASPWVLRLDEPTAVQHFAVVGVLVLLFEMFTFYALETWEEWINMVLGLWLVLSSWVLAISATNAVTNAVICGLLLIVVASYEIWDDRRSRRGSRG